jgi:hypothetical protein
MILIVNETQYNKILLDNKTSTISEWVKYVNDIILMNINKMELNEETFINKNLILKLNKFDFNKDLPIDSFIFNLIKNKNINDPNITFNPYWTTLTENKEGKKILKEVEFDVEIPINLDTNITMKIIKEKLIKEFIIILNNYNKGIII